MAIFALGVIPSDLMTLTPDHDYLFSGDASITQRYMREHIYIHQMCEECEVEVADPDGDGLGLICMQDKEAMFGDDDYFFDNGPLDSDPYDRDY